MESEAVFEEAVEERTPAHEINELFIRRWSPRAILPKPLEQEHLNQLFEAARWAPSTYNEQEWRFMYAQRDTNEWRLFFDALTKDNQTWCENAGTLLCIAGKIYLTRDEATRNPVRSFDCGAAFQNMALQAAEMGVVCHGMAGFDQETIRKNLQIPDDFAVEAMAALGYPGDESELPESYQKREQPRLRKPLEDIVTAGRFSFRKSFTPSS